MEVQKRATKTVQGAYLGLRFKLGKAWLLLVGDVTRKSSCSVILRFSVMDAYTLLHCLLHNFLHLLSITYRAWHVKTDHTATR